MYGNNTDNSPDDTTAYFYYLPKNTVDLLFLGDSHSYCTYISKQIFDETGIASASLATSSNSIVNSYWELKEVLKHQKPKVVVFETFSLESSGVKILRDDFNHYATGIANMPDYSLNKIKAYFDIKYQEKEYSYNISFHDIFLFIKYKEGYNKDRRHISEYFQFVKDPVREYDTFGYYPTTEVTKLDNVVPYRINNEYIDFETTVEYKYLNKIKELCDNNNIKLLLSRPLFYADYDLHFLKKQVDDWASENKIPIIDYFDTSKDGDYDYNSDFRDKGHFNYLGAKKATDYFIEYIKKHYSFEDHRGDSRYVLWENNNFDYNLVEETTKENGK